MQLFPELFQKIKVRPVENYPQLLRQSLAAVRPQGTKGAPTIAVLTPGSYNSAYFEHAFLADQMGVQLVEGQDLRVVDGHVAMRTTEGYKQIDVLYRRVDDSFLDPLTFRPDSALGVPGIMDVYRAGNITIANAPGTGIADDKAIYSYMPEIVEFLHRPQGDPRQHPDLALFRARQSEIRARAHPRVGDQGSARLRRLRNAGRTGGDQEGVRGFCKETPGKALEYIAQPTLALSTCPILTDKGWRRAMSISGLTCWSPTASRSCGRADARRAQGRLASRQFPRKAAAPRTHGCWMTDFHLKDFGCFRPDRQRTLLDEPLYRAGRKHGAPG